MTFLEAITKTHELLNGLIILYALPEKLKFIKDLRYGKVVIKLARHGQQITKPYSMM